jgi:hypothetical protein
VAVESFDYITILAALIGAIGGSLGGNFVADRLNQRREHEKLRNMIVYKYLIQLQYAIVHLRFTLDYRRKHLQESWFDAVSTLYVFGCVLAHHRIMLLEGVYSQIETVYPAYGDELVKGLELFGFSLVETRKSKLYRYEAIALGDALIEWKDSTVIVPTYLEFKEKYEKHDNSQMRRSLEPAKKYSEEIWSSAEDLGKLTNHLNLILPKLEKLTKIKLYGNDWKPNDDT